MGLGGISIWQLLIVLVIVLLLFGTKRLKNIGADLGNAVKGFRSAMSNADKDDESEPKQIEPTAANRTAAEESAPRATGSVPDQEKPKV